MNFYDNDILMKKIIFNYLKPEFDKEDKALNIQHRRYVFTYTYLNDENFTDYKEYEKIYLDDEDLLTHNDNNYLINDIEYLNPLNIKIDENERKYYLKLIKKEYFFVEIARFQKSSDCVIEVYKILKNELEKNLREEKIKKIFNK